MDSEASVCLHAELTSRYAYLFSLFNDSFFNVGNYEGHYGLYTEKNIDEIGGDLL
jgi:hypothetical protein